MLLLVRIKILKTGFIGAITDEDARSFDIKLDFLSDEKYEMTIYQDAKDAHWETNPMKYEIEKRQ